MKPPFESWGRYPSYDATLQPLHWQGDFPAALEGAHSGALAVGMGRSYGDVCLLNEGTLLPTTAMNRLLAFDAATGLLTAEAGITLAQILDFAVPRGYFLPVTPGTKYVTLGGAHRERHPRQKSSCRRHLRQPRHALRACAFGRDTTALLSH